MMNLFIGAVLFTLEDTIINTQLGCLNKVFSMQTLIRIYQLKTLRLTSTFTETFSSKITAIATPRKAKT